MWLLFFVLVLRPEWIRDLMEDLRIPQEHGREVHQVERDALSLRSVLGKEKPGEQGDLGGNNKKSKTLKESLEKQMQIRKRTAQSRKIPRRPINSLFALFILETLVAGPIKWCCKRVNNIVIRLQEQQADSFAMTHAGVNPDAFCTLLIRLNADNMAAMNADWLYTWVFDHYPNMLQRIEAAQQLATDRKLGSYDTNAGRIIPLKQIRDPENPFKITLAPRNAADEALIKGGPAATSKAGENDGDGGD